MGIATSSASNATTVTNLTVLRFTTDAVAAVDTTISLGFTPRTVRFINLTDRIQDEWFQGMADDSALHTIADGTATLATTNGITINETDGTVTFAAEMMVASKTFTVIAEA